MEDDEHAKLSPRSRKIEQDYSPEMFAARCQAAGLHTDVSSDPEHIYIRVGMCSVWLDLVESVDD